MFTLFFTNKKLIKLLCNIFNKKNLLEKERSKTKTRNNV